MNNEFLNGMLNQNDKWLLYKNIYIMSVDVSPVASAFGTIATMAYNDGNLRAERRRQAKLDAYNKEVTERNYQQQQMLNSCILAETTIKGRWF